MSAQNTISQIQNAQQSLQNRHLPITQRIRALFYLRNIPTPESAQAISCAFQDRSVLLKHEAAYVLGQMHLDTSKDVLVNLLRDHNEDEIVRHEAREALGNYLDAGLIRFLESFCEDESLPVRETCYLAVRKLREYFMLRDDEYNINERLNDRNLNNKNLDELSCNENYSSKDKINLNEDIERYIKENNKDKETNILVEKNGCATNKSSSIDYDKIKEDTTKHSSKNEMLNSNTNHNNFANQKIETISKFDSYDPAFPSQDTNFETASSTFLNPNECLYKRYKAMFFLRDLMSKEVVQVLGRGFNDKSSLFKHEVAFVFGQMKMNESTPYLYKTLCDKSEHGMVRHECAEALGAIETEESFEALLPFKEDEVDVVRESVEVAFDIHLHKLSDEEEYAVV